MVIYWNKNFVAIRIRPQEPDMSHTPEQAYKWKESAYGKISEVLTTDAPKTLGENVVTIS